MDWVAFHHYAAGRHGAVSPLVGPAVGIAASSLRRRATRDRWPRSPHPGVLLRPGSQPGFWREVSAGLASTRDLAVLSHRSAALCTTAAAAAAADRRGAAATPPWRARPPRLALPQLTYADRRASAPGRRTVDDDTVENLLDLSTVLSPQRLAYCVIDVLRRGLVTVADVRALLPLLATTAAGGRLARVLQEPTDDPVDSGFELAVRQGLRSDGLRPWPGPFPWRCPDGVVIHLDVAFPAQWVAIECDGRGKYAQGRLVHHRSRPLDTGRAQLASALGRLGAVALRSRRLPPRGPWSAR